MVSTEEKRLKERIRILLHAKKCPIVRLSDNPTLQSRYGRQINGTAAIPFSTIYLIMSMFPDVSAEWLIRGDGEMYINDRSGFYASANVHDNYAGGDINISQGNVNDKELENIKVELEEVRKDRDFLKGLLQAMTPQK